MPGTVTVLEDTLYVAGDNVSASVQVNTTAGTMIINTTASPGITYDILADYAGYAGGNLTVYSNTSGLIVERIIKFRWTGTFNWIMDGTTGRVYTSRSVNNKLDYTIWRPEIYIAFPPTVNVSYDTLSIYDVDNGVYLDPTVNYAVDYSGVRWEFANLTSGEARVFNLVFYTAESEVYNQYDTPSIRIDTIEWLEYTPEVNRYYGFGRWMNTNPSVFTGNMNLILDFKDAAKVDVTSIAVYDIVHAREVPAENWYVNGQIVVIESAYLGAVNPSDTVQFGVYFLYEEQSSIEAFLGPAFYLGDTAVPYTVLLILVGMALVGWGMITEKASGKSQKTSVLTTLGATIIIITLSAIVIIVLAATVGADNAEGVIQLTQGVARF
jgi:hypothetical protein